MKQIAFCLLIVMGLAVSCEADAGWPAFRGPGMQGDAGGADLPTTWSEQQNVTWKTPLPGRAWSSPVVLDGQIWLTTATPDGRTRSVLCVDCETGKIVRDIKVFDVEHSQEIHDFNSYASPTPVIEPGRVYVTWGSVGTACIDTNTGKILWTQQSLHCNHFRGAGSSLLLYDDLLILPYDGSDVQFLAAMDKRTGKVAWKTNRSVNFDDIEPDGKPRKDGDFRKAFATARVLEYDGHAELISPGSKATYAYDPRTGRELWRVEDKSSFSTSSTPVYGHGLLYLSTGISRGQLWAVRPGGRGVVNDTHVVWKCRRNAPKKPSVLLVDDLLYMLDDSGIVTCLDAKTGEEIWKGRTPGPVSASPIYASGRIYLFNELGKATIIAVGRTFQQLASNQLDEGFMASPAVVGNTLYLRTKTHLYRIENK